MITPRIDWLTVSAHYNKDLEVPTNKWESASAALTIASHFEANPALEEMPAQSFYRYCFRSEQGGIFRFGDTEAQGFGVVASGSYIGTLGGSDGVCEIFVKLRKRYLARATRVDVAFDFEGDDFENVQVLSALYNAWKSDQKGAKPKRMEVRGSDGVVETVAFGARASEKYMRVYDKAREQVVEAEWTRLEVEAKGNAASPFDGQWREFALSMLEGMTPARLDYAHETWSTVVAGMKGALGKGVTATPRRTISRDDGDTMRWWKHAVASTYRRMLREQPEIAAEMLKVLMEASQSD